MRTVVIRLRFTTPCLGNRRDDSKGGMLCHQRDGQGRIVFFQSWWDSAMARAASAYGRHQGEVRKIRWSPIVDGVPHVWQRYWKKDKYRRHEAFRAGDEVAVKAMVPTEIPLADFREILGVLGEFFGVSPFRHTGGARNKKNIGKDAGYGRFEIVELQEHGYHYQEKSEHAGGQPGGPDSTSSHPGTDVPESQAAVRSRAGKRKKSGR